MTKITLAALAATILAGTAFTSAAEAGGVRVGFGFPLGSFVARSHSPDAVRGYGSRAPNCHRRSARVSAPVRNALKKKQATQTAAHTQAPRKIKAKQVVVAKTESKPATNDAPVINVPGTPVSKPVAADIPTVQQPIETAAIKPEPAVTEIKAEAPKFTATTETVSKIEEVVATEKGKQVCRRFSALIGDLIDVPCK